MTVPIAKGLRTLFFAIPICLGLFFGAGASQGALARDVPLVQHTVTSSFQVPEDAAIADVDGDGSQDFVAAGDSEVAWWDNTAGNGTAWTKRTVASVTGGQSVAVADMDGDGDLDVAAAAHDSHEIFWAENTARNGTAWTKRAVNSSYTGAVSVFAADLDRDGDLDLVTASYESHRLDWWENTARNGSAWTQHAVDTGFTQGFEAICADLDGDGDMDIIGLESNAVLWWENTAKNGSAWTRHTVESPFLAPFSVVATDLDGDGDPDIACASSQTGVWWWENTARNASTWTRHGVYGSQGNSGLAATDLDGDGDPDLVSGGITGPPVLWFENTAGNASAWTTRTVAGSYSWTETVAAGDLDGDGDADILAGQFPGPVIAWWENQTIHRSATFPSAGKRAIDSGHNATYAAMVDLDRDGDLDFVASCCGMTGVAWWENAGAGWTYHVVDRSSFQGPNGVAVADVDRDGDLDIVATAQQQGQVAWYENNGSTGGWAKHLIYSSSTPVSVALADINRDGAVDVVCSFDIPWSGEVDWFQNNGAGGGWTKHAVDGSFASPVPPVARDMDRDGDTDVLCASNSGNYSEIAWWANDGSGAGWAKHSVTTAFNEPVSVAAGDFNRDGAPDVLAAGVGTQQAAWWANNGSGGGWTQHVVEPSFHLAQCAAAADLDGDGDLDALGCTSVNDAYWWENTAGNGLTWTRHSVDSSFGGAFSVGAADVDRDGRMDLFGGCQGDGLVWWRDMGGQFALPTTATASSVVAPGQIASAFTIAMNHRGRPGDHDEELSSLSLLFETAPGTSMTTAQASTLFSSLSVYLDNGDGTFDPASDTLAKSLTSFSLASGVQSVPFTHGDANVQLPFGTSKTFFAVLQIHPGLDGATSPANTFRLTHLTEATSTAQDRTAQIPLIPEYASNQATVLVSIALTYTWDGGGTTYDWSEAANWTGNLVPNHGCSIRFDGTSDKEADEDAAFQGTVASVIVDAPYDGSITQYRTLQVTGDFFAASGSYAAKGGLAVGGDFTCAPGVFDPRGGAVTFDGSGPQHVDPGGAPFYDLVLDNSSPDTITPLEPLTVQHSLHIQKGTLQASGDVANLQIDSTGTLQLNGPLAVRGNWSSDGTFAPGSQAVIFRPAGAQTAGGSAALDFHDLFVNDGLLGYWKLDDGTGTAAADASGFGHPGTFYHSPVWSTVAPPHNFRNTGSLQFQRADADYVLMQGTDEISALQTITMACWVKLNTMPSGVIERFVTILGEKAVLRYDGVNGTAQLHFYMSIGGSLRAIKVNGALSAGSWFHVAGTYDGSAMHLYLNGAEVGTPVPVTGTVGTGSGIRLSHAAVSEALDGWLDEVRIYNRALASSEIQSLASGSVPATSSGSDTFSKPVSLSGGLILNSGTVAGSASGQHVPAHRQEQAAGSGLVLSLAGDLTRNGGVLTPGSGSVTFAGASSQAVSGPLTFTDVTIATGAGVVLWSDASIAGHLALNSGDVFTGPNHLTLGASATSAGDYDVVGNVYRAHTFNIGTSYCFGSPYTTVNFSYGTPPTAIQVSLTKAPPEGLTPAVQRSYNLTATGGSSPLFVLRLHYRDSELDGTYEGSLQLWSRFGAGFWNLQGSTGASTAQNWVEEAMSGDFCQWAISSLGAPPGEASKPGHDMLASAGPGGSVHIAYTPAGCALDHTVYWGTGPLPGYCDWRQSWCQVGPGGTAVAPIDAPAPGHFTYFVVVGNNNVVEGSYGKDSAGHERMEAIMIPGCDYPQQIGSCP